MEDRSAAGRRADAQPEEGGTGLKRGLVALATAAVVSVYAAGYVRTEAAAERFEGEGAGRRGSPPPAISDAAASAVGPGGSGFTATVESSDSLPASEQGAPATRDDAPSAVADAGAPTAPAVAAGPAASAPETPAPASAPFRDGVYTGWGTSQHGKIEATVEVRGGRIEAATISMCRMRWPCARIAFLVPQVAERQSAEVDVITRVTDSSDAFYYALVEALSKAK
jgi:uncharacterized protein with FMN-binding domain